MGNGTPPNTKKGFDVQEWKKIPIFSYTNNSDPYYSSKFQVLQHKKIPYLQAQRYELFFNSQAQYISYLDSYYDRRKSSFLVSALHLQKGTQKKICSTFHAAALFLERIPIRLYEITDIPINEGLYMLESCLQGFEHMFSKTGFFQISSDMIGINKQGKVKIWVNRNFSRNFPEFNKINHNKNESDFIFELFNMIEECIDYSLVTPKISDFFFRSYKVITFKSAKSCIKEYGQKFNIVIAKIMKSILIIYRNHNEGNHCDSLYSVTEGEYQARPNTKRQIHRARPRHSVHKFDHTPQHFVKKNSLGDIDSGALHISFIKNKNQFKGLDQFSGEQFRPQPVRKFDTYEKKKNLPSISFHYQSANSPQNVSTVHKKVLKDDFSGSKKEYQAQKERKQVNRTTLKRNSRQDDKSRQNIGKQVIFQSSGVSYEIDSDIAYDLEYYNN